MSVPTHAAEVPPGQPRLRAQSRLRALAWPLALGFVVALMVFEGGAPWAFVYPETLVLPLNVWINALMRFLLDELDFGLFTFHEFTRAISWLLTQPMELAKGTLATGFKIELSDDSVLRLPPLSWLAVLGGAVLLAHHLKGWKLALLVGLAFLYLAVFGQWESAMLTLASVVVAVPLGAAVGLFFGILAYRSRSAEMAIMPVLDMMQTMPAFAYLVPVLIMFGFGPVGALVATLIYAIPPMVRVTILALRKVPEEIVEFGTMAGCSKRQMLWKVMLPTARPGLTVGVNQVIMLSLNMVIIASMIGAGGLGFDVLKALRSLWIGKGLEAGIAITLLAIAMDRLSQAAANRPPSAPRSKSQGLLRRHPHLTVALVVTVASTAAGLLVGPIQRYPDQLVITTAPFWDESIRYININFYDELNVVKNAVLLNVMLPFKRFLLSLPWLGVVGLIVLGGWQLGGWRLATLVGTLALYLVVTGLWEAAMISVYMIGIAVAIGTAFGIPLGVWASRNERVSRVIVVILDTLQTLPNFVYLMPVVMLFAVGDFSALIAVIVYAFVPAVRYTNFGIRQVPPNLIEASRAAGCTQRQILWKVQLPLALPEIMLGVNQVIMMGLAMLVITALIGTRDLGQEVNIGLGRADPGYGLVAGFGIAFIAMIADRLIGAWATRRKAQLGLPA